MPTVTLPPGFYEILFHTDDGTEKKVLTPLSVGLVITTGNVTDAPWQIQADGRISSISASGNQVQQYQTLTNNAPCQVGDYVTTSDREKGMSWMIYDVQYHIDETYIGHIMTNDGTKLFWSVDSADSSVRLRQIDDFCINSMPKFHFVPITPREGQYLNKFQRRNHRVVHGGQPPAMENGGGSNLAVILEAIFTLIIINLYVILEMARGNRAGKLNDLLPSWLAK
ncbi:hypothetical protein FB446DRAFT_197420 [Lentinula raphanica]|uniref:Uncharacterized protein n=1 Tax=Lentinula raphanica TaxID=153919 RepID=A0AA38UIS6_9AGAR|nr:hypothetical protein FB446DRAFT_197420 [Lentinula raphanica]KAJ3842476.1 hypothetical protein F5878DRAFT_392180 [Lentinula raphanica]